MTEKADDEKNAARWMYGLIAVGIGVLGIVGSLLIVIDQYETAADAASLLGIVVSPIAAITAAYFGVQAGSAGKEAADKRADKATDAAIGLAAESDPAGAREVLRRLRED
jgi:hypothetical protein